MSQVMKQYCSEMHRLFCDCVFDAVVDSLSTFKFSFLLHGSLFTHPSHVSGVRKDRQAK